MTTETIIWRSAANDPPNDDTEPANVGGNRLAPTQEQR